MDTYVNWNSPEISDLTLKQVYQQANLDRQEDIHWIVKTFENPKSPIALPGKISLHNHDCIHIILGKGITPEDEAFVIGFTMGNDTKTKFWHIKLFKFLSRFIYPPNYRFNDRETKIFDLGFRYGQNLLFRNINSISFDDFYNYKINDLRALLAININTIDSLSEA
ncbi:MAG: hypothetical protein ACFCAD_22080 [Pleurocapsa sp.]